MSHLNVKLVQMANNRHSTASDTDEYCQELPSTVVVRALDASRACCAIILLSGRPVVRKISVHEENDGHGIDVEPLKKLVAAMRGWSS